MERIRIYTDGACLNNQGDKNYGAWAAILVYRGAEKLISGYEKNTSNNKMELSGIIQGLKALKRRDIGISVYTDSAYVVNCFEQKWYVSWRKNGWKNSKKQPVSNRKLWEELIALYEGCADIEILKIKGHVDPKDADTLSAAYKQDKRANSLASNIDEYREHIEYNNRADAMAVEAATRAKDEEEGYAK